MDVIFPEMHTRGMETSLQKRLRIRLDIMEMNALQAAKKAGLGESFVRDILRGKTRSPNADNLAKLAAALDTTPDWFLGSTDRVPAKAQAAVTGLEVVGVIQAGNWLDRSILDDDGDHEIIPVARDPRFPHARQYSLLISGDSMNERYPDGSYVTCVDYFDAGVSLKPGLILHVERHSGPLVEITLKALEMVDGRFMLVPKSSNPRHVPLSLDGEAGSEIVLKGIVTGNYVRTEI